MRPLTERVGDAIREARQTAGMSQSDVSEALGCSKGQLSRLEHGDRRFKLDVLADVAHVLKVSAAELLLRAERLR